MSNSIAKDVVIATAKGVISEIPFVGGLFTEYINLTQSLIGDKRKEQWVKMVEEKLEKLQPQFETLPENELFYSCIQIATTNALRAHEEEKRQLFANALYNTVQLDLDDDKKLLFLSLLDRHTLSSIKLLNYYSISHYDKNNYIKQVGMMRTESISGTEHPIQLILKNNPFFENDEDYVKALSKQLASDSLISPIDFDMPQSPDKSRQKRTTKLGGDFLAFISNE